MPLPQRRGVHEATLGPKSIEAAFEPKGRVFAKMALENLTVVAHLLDDSSGPGLIQAQALAQARVDPEQPPRTSGSSLPRMAATLAEVTPFSSAAMVA